MENQHDNRQQRNQQSVAHSEVSEEGTGISFAPPAFQLQADPVQRQEGGAQQSAVELAAQKGPAVEAKVQELLAQGVSPSSISTFLRELPNNDGASGGGGGAAVSVPASPPAQARRTQAPIQRNADPIQRTGGRTEIEIPGITRMMNWWETQLFVAALALPPLPANIAFAATVEAMVAATAAADFTIGIGITAGAAGVVGGGVSGGIVISGGRIGFYGSVGADIGAIISASAEIVYTVVRGGTSTFGGTCFAMVFGGGEAVVGHLSILFNNSGFIGVAVSAGVGVGLTPVEAYVNISQTWVPPDE
jgi:hypothetical protein